MKGRKKGGREENILSDISVLKKKKTVKTCPHLPISATEKHEFTSI